MAKVTVFSEPLIEQFGRGFSAGDERPETPCSGDALNMASAINRGLERLGEYKGQPQQHSIGVFCGLGDDERGTTIRRFMKQEGLDTGNVITLPGRKSSAYTIHREEGGAKRSVEYHDRGPDSAMCQLLEAGPHAEQAARAAEDVARNSDVLVITGIGASRARSDEAFGKLVDMATAVRKRGGRVVIDFNHRFNASTGEAKLWVDDAGKPLPNDVVRERMDTLFAVSSIAFVAHDELWPVYHNVYQPPLTQGQEPTDAAPIVKHLKELVPPPGVTGPRDVVFKRGKDGGTLYHVEADGREVVFNTSANDVQTRDRNGGGDALIGGTIAGLLAGMPLEQSLNFGQKMAGNVIQHLGGVIRRDYLPHDHALDRITGVGEQKFAGRQQALEEGLRAAPFVPVFQLTTHNGRNTIAEDAQSKVAAMHKGGIRQFEFLLRGDETMPLDDYITQVLASINTLAKTYPDARFGVGTVSSQKRMQNVVENPNVAFIVTAHWPGEEMIATAIKSGKPIIPTVSNTDIVTISADGKIAAPGKDGTNSLNPERIKKLRAMGVEAIKVFDFGSIAAKRATAASLDPKDDATLIASGLVAIAEAIRDSHDGTVPKDKQFYAMTTGGVTKENLPYLAAGVKSQKIREKILDITGSAAAAEPVMELLQRTTVVAGGTFITKDYDKATDAAAASRDLEVLSRGVVGAVAKGQMGVVDSVQIY